jgi:hypothetical protein
VLALHFGLKRAPPISGRHRSQPAARNAEVNLAGSPVPRCGADGDADPATISPRDGARGSRCFFTPTRALRALYNQTLWGGLAAAGVSFIPADSNTIRARSATTGGVRHRADRQRHAGAGTPSRCQSPVSVNSAWGLICTPSTTPNTTQILWRPTRRADAAVRRRPAFAAVGNASTATTTQT